jgi:LPXTG-motif cell wall-anchored protein
MTVAAAVIGAAGPAYAQPITVETAPDWEPTVVHCDPDYNEWVYLLSGVGDPSGIPIPDEISTHMDGGGTATAVLDEVQTSPSFGEAFYRLAPAQVPPGQQPTGHATAELDTTPGAWVGQLHLHAGHCTETSATLTASTAVAVQGQEITLSGVLSRAEDGAPLADRPVQISYQSNEPDAVGKREVQIDLVTGLDGRFQAVASDDAPGPLNFSVFSQEFGPFAEPFAAEFGAHAATRVLSLPSGVPTADGSMDSTAGATFRGETELSGEGFAPGADVALAIYSTPTVLAVTQANNSGAFQATVTVPADLAGEHTLVAAGEGPDGQLRYLVLTVTIQGDENSGGAGGGLPVTGTTTLTIAVMGGLLLVAGLVVWFAARRRRTTFTA